MPKDQGVVGKTGVPSIKPGGEALGRSLCFMGQLELTG